MSKIIQKITGWRFPCDPRPIITKDIDFYPAAIGGEITYPFNTVSFKVLYRSKKELLNNYRYFCKSDDDVKRITGRKMLLDGGRLPSSCPCGKGCKPQKVEIIIKETNDK